LAWRGHGGGQPGEQDVESAFELGGAVVGGQDGCQAAEQGESRPWRSGAKMSVP
jgi:hypothetical protein